MYYKWQSGQLKENTSFFTNTAIKCIHYEHNFKTVWKKSINCRPHDSDFKNEQVHQALNCLIHIVGIFSHLFLSDLFIKI